jgi:hypothetical protein
VWLVSLCQCVVVRCVMNKLLRWLGRRLLYVRIWLHNLTLVPQTLLSYVGEYVVGGTLVSCIRIVFRCKLCNVWACGATIARWWIETSLEASGRGLVEVMYGHFPREDEEKHENRRGHPVFRPRFERRIWIQLKNVAAWSCSGSYSVFVFGLGLHVVGSWYLCVDCVMLRILRYIQSVRHLLVFV